MKVQTNLKEQYSEDEGMQEKQKLLMGGDVSQYKHQKTILIQAAEKGRELLQQKNYLSASKELSKAVLAFEFILKNNQMKGQMQEQLKSVMKDHIVPVYLNLSLSYMKMEDYAMCSRFCDQVLTSDKNNLKALYRKALSCAKLHQSDAAQQCIRQGMALENAPHWRQLHILCNSIKSQDRKQQRNIAKKFLAKPIYQDKYSQPTEKGCCDRILQKISNLWNKVKAMKRKFI